jgi:hypothetical protein
MRGPLVSTNDRFLTGIEAQIFNFVEPLDRR